jgi:hypothetical protein
VAKIIQVKGVGRRFLRPDHGRTVTGKVTQPYTPTHRPVCRSVPLPTPPAAASYASLNKDPKFPLR